MPPRTSFETIDCSIARTMAVLGEPWTALILRDLFIGITRFDALHSHLGASRKILTLRLYRLVNDEIVVKRAYAQRPERLITSLRTRDGSCVTSRSPSPRGETGGRHGRRTAGPDPPPPMRPPHDGRDTVLLLRRAVARRGHRGHAAAVSLLSPAAADRRPRSSAARKRDRPEEDVAVPQIAKARPTGALARSVSRPGRSCLAPPHPLVARTEHPASVTARSMAARFEGRPQLSAC